MRVGSGYGKMFFFEKKEMGVTKLNGYPGHVIYVLPDPLSASFQRTSIIEFSFL